MWESNIPRPEAALKEAALYEKKSEQDSKAMCSAMACMILSVFALNLFTFLYSSFLVIALNGYYESWKNWRRVVHAFYVLAVVILVIAIVLSLAGFILGAAFRDPAGIVFGLVILTLSVLEMVYCCRSKDALEQLYGKSNLSLEKVHASTEQRLP